MKTPDFSASFSVEQSPQAVFDAITNVRGWWSEDVEGRTDVLDAVFFHHYQDVHVCKLKIVEFVPEKKVVWQVMNNYFNFVKNEKEWKGTSIHFDISEEGNRTHLRFVHKGLSAQDECFDVCSNAWSGFINRSLHNLITTGKGQPNPREGSNSFYARLVEEWKRV